MNYFENDNSFLWQTNKLEDKRREGIEKGKLEGEKNKSILIAKNLKKSGLDVKFISENTGLSLEEVEKL